jgi:adenylyl-sulfate kinase
MSPAPGHVFWLFGLSGAGKSTLAGGLASALRAAGTPVLALDGDALRAGLCRGLGFSDADRAENLRRAAETARLGADSGLCVVAAFITPQQAHRTLISEVVGRPLLSWIYLDAPLDVCRQRDVKGLYARADAGQVKQMTGLSSSFEPPAGADLVVPTAREEIAASSARLLEFARARLRAGRA